MKNLKQLILAILLPLGFIACEQKSGSPKAVKNISDSARISGSELKIDSLKLEDSTKVSANISAHFRQNVLLFSGLQKPVLDSLYKAELYRGQRPLAEYSNSAVQGALEKNMADFFADVKKSGAEYTPDFHQNWDQFSDMKPISNEAGYLTINYFSEGYSGGAHGYANNLYKVVDLQKQKIVQLSDIVDTQKVNWNRALLKALGNRTEELFDKKTLTYNSNFYFDKDKLHFVYGQYEIAPYASGIIEIEVPYVQISKAMKPEFKKRMNVK